MTLSSSHMYWPVVHGSLPTRGSHIASIRSSFASIPVNAALSEADSNGIAPAAVIAFPTHRSGPAMSSTR
jgi:hypothetical protein